jgi:transmembrane sensor
MKMPSDRREAAAAWLAAQRRVVMSIEERAAFEAWREDPENLKALNAMQALWDDMAILKGEAPPLAIPVRRVADRRRPAALAAAAGLIVVSLGALSLYASGPLAFARSATTGIGEQKSTTLPDGSVVSLNVATRLEYRMHPDSRDVRLREGQALFVVEKDKTRPFLVRAGDYEVRAVGTAFDVQVRNGDTQVAVQEGVVAVVSLRGSRAGQEVARLKAGEKVDLRGTTAPAAAQPQIQTVAVQDVAEWRLRTLAYADAPLSEVVSDLNRYFPDPIVIGDPSIADRRVTLRLQISDRSTTLKTLDALLGEDIEAGPVAR